MMQHLHKNRGMTLIELIIACTIGTMAVLAVVEFSSKTISFFMRSSVKSQLTQDSRNVVNVIVPLLQKGIPGSAVFCPCPGLPCTTTCSPAPPPYPQIQFNTSDAAYTFYSVNNTVQMIAVTPQGTVGPRTLASNVTSLAFGLPTPSNQSMVTLSLNMQATTGANTVETVELPNILVHMLGG